MTKTVDAKKYIIPFLIIAAAMLVAYAIVANAQETQTAPATEKGNTTAGITFPVPELGGCADKDACKTYCNNPDHMDSCIAFAKSHGLMNADEASRAGKFRATLQTGGGPGGCKTPDECRIFCSDISHIDACMSFAKAQGIRDENVSQGEKIQAYVKAGGQMPGGCTSKESCMQYCGDFSHAKECFAFAEKAGIGQGGGPAGGTGGPKPENIQKFLELAQSGDTPGGCKSKDECMTYCQDQTHRDECVAFGVKAGFIKQDEADKIKILGGKGPGGCDSSESCRAFCNDPTHREECFTFAQEHGFLTKEEAQQTKQGQVSLRAGLEQAPPEVAECLKSNIGQNTLDDIQSGNLVPGQEIGGQVKNCFEKFGHRNGSGDIFKNAPPEVASCLKEKLGDTFNKIQSGESQPTPEVADTFRVCFQTVQILKGNFGEGTSTMRAGQNGGSGGPNGGPGGPGGPQNGGFQNFLRSAPPGVASCLGEKLGSDFQKLQSGEVQPTQEIGAKAKECFGQFRPENDMRAQNPQNLDNGLRGPGRQGGRPICISPVPELKDNVAGCMEYCKKNPEECQKARETWCQDNPEQCNGSATEGGHQGGPGQNSGMPGQGMPEQRTQGFDALQSVPSQIKDCVKGSVDAGTYANFEGGSKPAADVETKIKTCYDQIRGNAVGGHEPQRSPGPEEQQRGSMHPGYQNGNSSSAYSGEGLYQNGTPGGQNGPMPYDPSGMMKPSQAYSNGTYPEKPMYQSSSGQMYPSQYQPTMQPYQPTSGQQYPSSSNQMQPYQPASGGGMNYSGGGTYPPPPNSTYTQPSGGTTYPSSGGYQPPQSGTTYPQSYQPPSGTTHPSGGMTMPPPGGPTAPPSGSMPPPPGGSPPPSSLLLDRQSVLGLILSPLSPILNLFVR